MPDLEAAWKQLQSWVDNQTEVMLVFGERGFCVSLTQYGTLEHWGEEGLFIFQNSLARVGFDPRKAFPEVRFEDGVQQVRLGYGGWLLSIFERKAAGCPRPGPFLLRN